MSSAYGKYNILFISADDLNNDIGPYGNTFVKTPNLDRLAKMSTTFTKAYCQQPLCGPSRASVMSGLRPNTSKCYKLNDKIREKVPDVVTLPQYFMKKGYFSGRAGKIYHYNNPAGIGSDGADDVLSWQQRHNPVGIDKKHEEKIIRFPGHKNGTKGQLGISMSYWDPVSEDEEHTDGMVTSKTIEMIENNKDIPFFVACGFFRPHCPYVAPKKYFDLYPMESIELENFSEAIKDLDDVPPMALTKSGKYKHRANHEQAKKCKQAYYASISFLDAQVGRLLDCLEENHLLEKTIIVFWSDHGYFLGEKGLWYKAKNFERALLSPMMISIPGQKANKFEQPVELLDIYPTLIDASFDEAYDKLDGESLVSYMKNPKKERLAPAISQNYYTVDKQGYSIRSQRWRYTEWMEGDAGLELYDHNNDPEEKVNLAQKPEYASVIKELSKELRKHSQMSIK